MWEPTNSSSVPVHPVTYIWLFSRTGHFLDLGDKLLPVIQHGFLRSEENVIPIVLNIKKVYGKILNFIISIIEYGWCYCHICRQILLPWQMLMPMILWQMLLPYFPCIIYLWQMLLSKDYAFIFTFIVRQMLLPHICGRCWNHIWQMLFAKWQME